MAKCYYSLKPSRLPRSPDDLNTSCASGSAIDKDEAVACLKQVLRQLVWCATAAASREAAEAGSGFPSLERGTAGRLLFAAHRGRLHAFGAEALRPVRVGCLDEER